MPLPAKLADTPTLIRLNEDAASNSHVCASDAWVESLDPQGRHVGISLPRSDGGPLWTAWLTTITGHESPHIVHIEIPALEFEALADTTVPSDRGPELLASAKMLEHALERVSVTRAIGTRRPS